MPKIKPSTIIMITNKCTREEAKKFLKEHTEEAKKIIENFLKKS